MVAKQKLVNLDAMIPRADFAVIEDNNISLANQIQTIALRDLESASTLLPSLRKPDFQRETNHWSPDQVRLFIKSFVEGDLIPSVILWKAETAIFVIDGGHRLSVLRAWIEDDYGDGPLSQQFFGYQITDAQKDAAKRTRNDVNADIGSWQSWQAKRKLSPLPEADRKKLVELSTRALAVQWVFGNADRAQDSFFKINTQGTPLDEIETLLIRNRKRPCAIAARSIIRAGMGHKYWSNFDSQKQKVIEEKSQALFQLLFEPETQSPIKTLDLPLGGAAGVRTALSLLIDFVLVSSRDQHGKPEQIEDEAEDSTGDGTIEVLDRSLKLLQWMTGNTGGSLGLHPAVYFYGPSGRFAAPLFMGMATLIARKLLDNDSLFFKRFTTCRQKLEETLLNHKQLIAAIIQQTRSGKRYETIAALWSYLIDSLEAGKIPTEQDIIEKVGVNGKVIVGVETGKSSKFSDDTKSAVFLREALAKSLRCPICQGYLEPSKSVSYDHVVPRRSGGKGIENNCQMSHPYCNQSIKQ